jgi:hypothetical protein
VIGPKRFGRRWPNWAHREPLEERRLDVEATRSERVRQGRSGVVDPGGLDAHFVQERLDHELEDLLGTACPEVPAPRLERAPHLLGDERRL